MMTISSIDGGIATGWVCPKCGRVYAPWQMMCTYCGNQTIVSTGTGPAIPAAPELNPFSPIIPSRTDDKIYHDTDLDFNKKYPRVMKSSDNLPKLQEERIIQDAIDCSYTFRV